MDFIGYHFGKLYRQTSTSNPPLFENKKPQGEVIHWPLFKAFLVTLTYLTFRKLQNTMKIFVKAKAKLVFLIMLMTYFAVLLYQARTETLSPIPSQSQVWISLGEQLYWDSIQASYLTFNAISVLWDTLYIWIGLCWGKNSQQQSKKNFPYEEAALRGRT